MNKLEMKIIKKFCEEHLEKNNQSFYNDLKKVIISFDAGTSIMNTFIHLERRLGVIQFLDDIILNIEEQEMERKKFKKKGKQK